MTDEEVKMPTLTRYEILNLNDVFKHFKEAQKHRATRATDANDSSSRSHCLFVIDIVQQERTEKNPAQPDISFLKDVGAAQKAHKPPPQPKKPRDGAASPNGSSPKAASPTSHIDPSLANFIYLKDQPPIMYSKVCRVRTQTRAEKRYPDVQCKQLLPFPMHHARHTDRAGGSRRI